MPEMNKINRLIEVLPNYMVACLESPEYAALFEDVSEKFELTDQQRDIFEETIVDIFLGDLALADVLQNVRGSFGFDEEKTKRFARDIIGEFTIPFSYYFQDSTHVLDMLGGNKEEYFEKSTLFGALNRIANEQVVHRIQEIRALDINHQRLELNRMIEKNLVEYVSTAHDTAKIALNELTVYLLTHVENYHTELLRALYENKQTIGEGVRIQRDEKTYPPLTFHWLKDFISYSNGAPSTMHIAQYIAQNKNVHQLDQADRETLRHVLEIYLVLKLFPQSLARIPQNRWMIIPYKREEAPLKHTSGSTRAVPLEVHERQPSRTILPPELAIPELMAPSASAHSFAPVAVQTAVVQKPDYEEIHDEFFIDQSSKTPVQEHKEGDKDSEKQKKPLFSGKNYEELANEVLTMSGTAVSDSVMRARLQNMVMTRLRNIRTAIEIRERLRESVQKGGCGLDVKSADSIVRNANMAADLLSQGVLNVQEILSKEAPVETDIQEIKELVKREFAPEQKKFGRSRIVPRVSEYRHSPPPPSAILGTLAEHDPLKNIPVASKKRAIIPPPLPPPPPPQSVKPIQLAQMPQRAPIPAPYAVPPPKMNTPSFKKALKSIPALFSKKSSVRQKQSRPFSTATEPPRVQHAGLPAFSIKEVDGVPMIVEKQKESQAVKPSQPTENLLAQMAAEEQKIKEQAAQIEALKKEMQKKEEEEKSRKLLQEQKAQQEAERAKRAAEEQKMREKIEKEKKIEAEQAARIEALKKEMQKKEEEEKSRRRANEQKAQQEAERAKRAAEEQKAQEEAERAKKVAEEQKAREEAEKKKKTEEQMVSAEIKATGDAGDKNISSAEVMPHAQNSGSKSLFSNIFHIPVNVKTGSQQPGKVSFSDIKTSPRLIDTVEELRIFTLKDFRRLSEDPMNAAARIFDKIQSLERESFTKKLTAIAAWRENEINMLYVQIGQEALLKGKSITHVIDEMKKEGKQYLTEQEFDAVLELNERIRT